MRVREEESNRIVTFSMKNDTQAAAFPSKLVDFDVVMAKKAAGFSIKIDDDERR